MSITAAQTVVQIWTEGRTMAEYIKRDWLMKERHGCNRKCAECDFAQDGDSWCEGELFIVDVLRAPAADVVEVVHASWVWNPDGMDWGIGAWVCGKCKSRPETWWNTVKESHPLRCSGSRYCGNCGAKMDGGQDDV